MEVLANQGRLVIGDKQLRFKSYLSDFEYQELSNWWDNLGGAGDPFFVVQTNVEIVKRCILMTTDQHARQLPREHCRMEDRFVHAAAGRPNHIGDAGDGVLARPGLSAVNQSRTELVLLRRAAGANAESPLPVPLS
jgi:hypothetical protein